MANSPHKVPTVIIRCAGRTNCKPVREQSHWNATKILAQHTDFDIITVATFLCKTTCEWMRGGVTTACVGEASHLRKISKMGHGCRLLEGKQGVSLVSAFHVVQKGNRNQQRKIQACCFLPCLCMGDPARDSQLSRLHANKVCATIEGCPDSPRSS